MRVVCFLQILLTNTICKDKYNMNNALFKEIKSGSKNCVADFSYTSLSQVKHMKKYFMLLFFLITSGSKKNGDDDLKKIAADIFNNGGCVAPHTLNV